MEPNFIQATRVNRQLRLALEILADAGEHGSTDPSFLARFTPELLDLVRNGLATVQREITRDSGSTVEVARIRITDAGLTAIESAAHSTWH